MTIMYAMLEHEYITVLKKRNANTVKCPQIKRIVCCQINNIRINIEINELKIHNQV